MEFWQDLRSVYDRQIVQADKEQAFWLLIAFLLTFGVVRLITLAIRAKRGPFRNIHVKGVQVHHLVPGIILILISGYCSIALRLQSLKTLEAVAFGVGAALTLDEFALWIHLEDVYWEERGRRSIDIVIIAAVLASVAVLGFGFWRGVSHILGQLITGNAIEQQLVRLFLWLI